MKTRTTAAVAGGTFAAALMIVTAGCDHIRSKDASATTTEKKPAVASESTVPVSDRYKTGGEQSH
jgi:hypothetical protein